MTIFFPKYEETEDTEAYIKANADWAEQFFLLDDLERRIYENCIESFCLEVSLLRDYGSIDDFLSEEQIGCIDFNWEVTLLAIRAIYKERYNEYKIWATNKVEEEGDRSFGEVFAEFLREIENFISLLKNAIEVELWIEEDKIKKCRIRTIIKGKVKSILASHIIVDLLDGLKEKGDNILSSYSRSIILGKSDKDKDEIMQICERLESCLFVRQHIDEKAITFGENRNECRDDFIYSLYPLFLLLSHTIAIEYPPIFENYSKKDYYRFIIDFIEIDPSLINIDQIEYYLKNESKIKPYTGHTFSSYESVHKRAMLIKQHYLEE